MKFNYAILGDILNSFVWNIYAFCSKFMLGMHHSLMEVYLNLTLFLSVWSRQGFNLSKMLQPAMPQLQSCPQKLDKSGLRRATH